MAREPAGRKGRIEARLTAALQPEHLQVLDESHLHAGHGHDHGNGHEERFDGSGETHFRVRVVSAAFSGLSRVARHRLVNEALAAELATGLHALAVEPSAPGEPRRR